MDSFEHNVKSSFMDTLDQGYPVYSDPYLQDTSSPVLMSFNNTGLPSPSLEMNALGLGYHDVSYPTYANTSSMSSHIPQRPLTPPDGMGIAPPHLSSYQLAPATAPDMSPSQSSRASGTQSPPPSIPLEDKIPRSHRYTPIVPPAKRPQARAQRRRRVAEDSDVDDDDEDFKPGAGNLSGTGDDRKELVRRQRIESEQKRRDDLRDGYTRLKDILPASSQKSSKVVLLERATNQIKFLDAVKAQLERRLEETEAEMRRLRRVNDALMEHRAMQPAVQPVVGMPGY